MTDLQKKQIVAMRNEKATYAAISETLGIPVSTIKTFCRRNGMVTETSTGKLCCKNCGTELIRTPNAKPRLFCSDRCKQIWWNRHRYEHSSVKIFPHTCPICGKIFVDYSGANRKYCSQECYRKRGAHDGQ